MPPRDDPPLPPPLADDPASSTAVAADEGKAIEGNISSSSDEAPATATSPPSPTIFIKGLRILPPRQKKATCDDVYEEEDAVALVLPPLRPEEPVASLRGALGEVLGYAHLTRYRLVVESRQRRRERVVARANSSGGKKLPHLRQLQPQPTACSWSPYTLKGAMVTTPPSLKSLGAACDIKMQVAANDAKKEEEEELVLDEYGDLSILLPLLMKENEDDGKGTGTGAGAGEVVSNDDGANAGVNKEVEVVEGTQPNDANENTANAIINQEEEKIILDAYKTGIVIRVVLERYDLASIRDHMSRVRNLLKGNAPYVTSLIGVELEDEEEGDESTNDTPSKTDKKVEDNSAEEKKTEEGTVAVVDNSTSKDGAKDGVDVADEPIKEELAINSIATTNIAQMTSCLPEYDALVDSALKDGDLTHFYYLVCGEESTLHKLIGERKDSIMEGESLGNFIQDEKTKKVSNSGISHSGSGGRKNKKKSKIGKDETPATRSGSSTAANAAAFDIRKQSIADIERRMYDLNDTTCISMTVRLSGYHPPPPHRRVLGDLAYLEVTFPDGSVAHVTAFLYGFYINRSTATKFNPTPAIMSGGGGSANEDACYSHALLDCLLQKSTSMRSAWLSALVAAKERSDLLVQLTSPSSAHSSPASGSANDDDFVLYNNLFRNVASVYPNNAAGPAAGDGGMTMNMGMLLPATTPSTFVSRLDLLTVRPPWLVPLPTMTMGDIGGPRQSTFDHDKMHSWDTTRAEEELTSFYGMDIRGGGLRDWNEELQTARELPVKTFGERMERARLVHKVLSDFGDAALQGVKAILDGYIQPMNPNETARSHVYLHNNIFFSRAIDTGLDTFKIIQGDAAVKKSASRDALNMGVLHRLDIPGLNTLATVLVEYLGMRIVCQSVVPGILHGEKSHSLLYGAVETLSELQCNHEMHTLLESSIGEACMIATRTIPAHPLTDERMDVIKKTRITPLSELVKTAVNKETNDANSDEKKKSVQFCGPMEMKGILGSDKRKYVLDCTRLTPRDANWVSKSSGGTGRWEECLKPQNNTVPPNLDDDEWTVCVLRTELVASYAELKIARVIAPQSEDKNDEPMAKSEPITTMECNGVDKEWVNVPERERHETTELMKKDDFALSLRFNVNVFLPFARSIESIDSGLYETLKNDEEEARQIARHLWDTVIPNLTKDIRSSSVSGLQIPVNGQSLTELIHLRGINCRYLGRLAEAAKKEEHEDAMKDKAATAAISADKKPVAPPRFTMPHCWLELLECEMVARAAKHVLDSYMIERATSQPAQMIASFLSAIMSVGEESAGETELRMSKEYSDSSILDQDAMNALTISFVTDGEDSSDTNASSPCAGRGEIWSDIEREIGRRYRYALSLYNDKSSAKKDGKESRALYMPLLRRICQRSGIRLVARKYDLGNKCVCVGGRGLAATFPIAPTDVLDVLPLVKHAASVFGESFAPCSFTGNNAVGSSLHVLLPDAKTRFEVAHEGLTNRNDPMALEYAQEATAMYQQVVDSPLHPQISKCLKLTAIAYVHKDQFELALAAALKYLAVTVSLNGFDSVEVLNAHLTLSDILLRLGKPEGVRHLRAANFLMEFMAGKNYTGISSQYYRLGSHYYDAGKLEDALYYFEAAGSKRSEDRMFDCIVARHSSGILARLERFKQALDYEKTAYQLYVTHFGEKHEATKFCATTLERLTKAAVEQEKMSKIQEKERVKENAANAVADEIRAFEEAEGAKPIKKKKQNKKKGKK